MNLKSKFCTKPFEFVEIRGDGNISLCCYTWLSYIIGKIGDKTSIREVFNSKISQEIRHSILDGSFKFCNHSLCPYIRNGSLPEKDDILDSRWQAIINNDIVDNMIPDFYHLCYDESCNLSCPMCRSKAINHSTGPEFEKRLSIQKQVIDNVFGLPHKRDCTVNITGSGDPFGSKVYRDMLFNLDGENFPNVEISLQTNGVMFTPRYWEKMKKIQKNIEVVIVSFDAGIPETYKITRRGGNWHILQENIQFLSQLRRNNQISYLRMDFVIQAANFREMLLFVNMGKQLEVDRVSFSLLYNSGIWNNDEFSSRAVWQETHPEFEEYVKVTQNAILKDPIVTSPKLYST